MKPSRLRDLRAAVGLLTIVPAPRPDAQSAAFARATLFFPVVGLLIGVVLIGVNRLLNTHLPAWGTALVVVGVWEVLSRGATWQVGSVWGTVSLAAKIVALSLQVRARPAALLFAPMLARWGIVVLATGARDAGTPAHKFNPAITFREFAVTSVYTCAVVFSVAEALGILLVVCVGAVILALRLLSHRWAGGVSWRFLLAGAQGIETLVVVLCALL